MKKLLLLILALALFGFPSKAGGVCLAQSPGAGDDTLKQALENAFLNPPGYSSNKRKSIDKALEKLFENYDAADSDEDEIAALEKIINYSVKHRQDSALFYALNELYECYTSINYKTADSIYLKLFGIAEEYDNPMLTFFVAEDLGKQDLPRFYTRKQKRDFLTSNREKFQQRRSEFLYDYLLGYCGYYVCIPVVEFCSDDYEYMLWYQFFEEEDDKLLKDYVKGRHPQEEILEVASAISVYQHYAPPEKKLQQKRALEGLIKKYEGTCLEFFLRGATILMKRDSGESSQDWQKQYNNCIKFLEDISLAKKKYKAFSSYLQRLEVDVMGEKSRLEKKEVRFFVEKGKVRAALNNVDKLDFSILKPGAQVSDKPETVFRKRLKSDKDSYGLYDTIVFDLPRLDDGYYIFEGKAGDKVLGNKKYTQQTISVALLRTRDGYRLLTSDAITGKPLKEYFLRIIETDLSDIGSESMGRQSYNLRKRLFSTTITADTLDAVLLDGEAGKVIADFEKSVESLYDNARDQILALRVSYTDKDGFYRCSPLVPVGRFLPPKSETDIDTNALLMTDNVLYHPKDSLRFKVVAYRGNVYSSLNTLEEGNMIKADLHDAEGNLIESKELRLGAFGSASSSFFIPEGKKNGRWKMEVSTPEGLSLLWREVRVDDYSLPTYFMEIDPCNTMFKVGDTITVTGKIEGYSGHPVTDADVKMIVEIKDEDEQEYKVVLQRKVQASAGGLVSECFVPEKSGRYTISFVITDQSGETQGFWTDRYVDCDARCRYKIVNRIKGGKYFLDDHLSYRDQYIITSDTLLLSVDIYPDGAYGRKVSWNIPYKYSVWDINGNEVIHRDNLYGERLTVDLSSLEDGVYDVEAYYDKPGGGHWDMTRFLILRGSLPDGVESVFIPNDTDDPVASGIDVMVGVSADVFLTAAVSCGGTVMEHRMLHLDGDRRLHKVSFDYPDVENKEATVGIVYARGGRLGYFKMLYPKKSRNLDLTVESVEFKDELSPGKEYRFSFKADSPEDIEAVVSAYDASADAILKGYEAEEARWKTVSLKEPYANQAFSVYAGAGDFNNGEGDFLDDVVVRGFARSVGSAVQYVGGALRSDFNDVLCFIPHIVSKDSTISFTVKTSDKLSRYHLNLFAHTRDMHNGFLQKDFTVTLPVKVSISPPRYLYRGDKYDISATVSSKSADCDGIARIMAIETTESSFDTYSLPLALAGGTSSSFNKIRTIGSCDTLDVNVYYMSDKYSDGVYVKIPLKKDVQILTESHSAVLLSSGNRDEALKYLKGCFRNMSPEDAEEKEETVSDILQRLISESDTPKDKNLISVMDAFCFAKMLEGEQKSAVPDTVWTSILSFRNKDGGFAWLKQMPSNQSITAAALERFSLLREMGCDIPDVASSVRYLDSIQFARNWPWWCGGLNVRQYLYVRSLFPEVPFRQSLNASNRDRISEFRTDARNYLSPSKSSVKKDIVSKYDVLELAHRSAVIRNLLSSESGRKLLKSLTGKSYSESTLQKTLDEDIFHLTDHAVHHPDGGSYYPNAVMPMRGVIENEAYAHSLIADVLSAYSKDHGSASRAAHTASRAGEVADQVRLWLILQAQTQDWDKNLYFLNAVRSINQASDSIKRISVLTLSNTEEKQFESIVQSGNGMKIERVLYRDSISTVDGTSGLRARIRVGDTLRRGEKIIAEYRIWNKENRSFVTVTAPREACMMPVNQLSGRYFSLKSLIVDGYYSFQPTGFRSVETDRTRYYFDVLPEETTVLTEEFFVVQDGVYTAPVIEVECSYAPGYRANGAFGGRIPVSR